MRAIYLRIAVVIALLAGAAWAGLWLGELTAPTRSTGVDRPAGARSGNDASRAEEQPGRPAPPLYFFANLDPSADWPLVTEQMAMAAEAGIQKVAINAPFPWEGDDAALDALADRLELIETVYDAPEVTLYLRLDPPAGWLEAHPREALADEGQRSQRVSLASSAWREAVRDGAARLARALQGMETGGLVRGVILACHDDGQWRTSDGRDRSEPGVRAFREWLAAEYGEDEALRAAWDDEEAALAEADVPAPLEEDGEDGGVFYALPAMQPQVDYLRFASEFKASRIIELVNLFKDVLGDDIEVFAPYGLGFELLANDSGHLAMSRVLDSAIDGFVSPVSYIDRGLGGTGGFMGPVDSALNHGKQWLIIDDTRTGIGRDPETGEVGRMTGLRSEDVYNVQTRNFAAALTKGIGLMWADAAGEGALHDRSMWARFARMKEAYQDVHQTHGGAAAPRRRRPESTVAVVLDERSRFYQRDDGTLNELLLHQTREMVLRTGAPAKFVLLSDILSGNGPQAGVYLFPNLFYLSESDRETLHEFLERRRAAAIWLYAPGYFAGEPSVENIAHTVRMSVDVYDGPSRTGSVFRLGGRVMGNEEAFGAPGEWSPLFYIDDEDTNVLAEYQASGDTSIAVEFLDEGWASVFIAEPMISAKLLREILHLLEQHVYYQPGEPQFYDAAYFGAGVMAIHAQGAGERRVNLGRNVAVTDLLDPDVGWPPRNNLALPLTTGDTRLFELTPTVEE